MPKLYTIPDFSTFFVNIILKYKIYPMLSTADVQFDLGVKLNKLEVNNMAPSHAEI